MAGPGGGGRPGGGAPRSGGRGESENSLLLSLMRELTGSLSALSHLAHQAAISHQTAARHADAFGKKLDFGSHAVTSFGHALLAGAHLHKTYQSSIEAAARSAQAKAQADERWALTQKRWADQAAQAKEREVAASKRAADWQARLQERWAKQDAIRAAGGRGGPTAKTAAAQQSPPSGVRTAKRLLSEDFVDAFPNLARNAGPSTTKRPPNVGMYLTPDGESPLVAKRAKRLRAATSTVPLDLSGSGRPAFSSIFAAGKGPLGGLPTVRPGPNGTFMAGPPASRPPAPSASAFGRPMPAGFAARLGAARAGGGGGGLSGLTAGLSGIAKLAGPAAIGLLAFGAGLEIAAKATQMAAGVLSYAAQKASPQTWNTLTKSFDLVAASVGKQLVPGMVRWSAWLQQTAVEAEMGVGVGGRLTATIGQLATAMDALGRGTVHVIDGIGVLSQAMRLVPEMPVFSSAAKALQGEQGEPTWIGKLVGGVVNAATGGLAGAMFGKKAGPGNEAATKEARLKTLEKLSADTKMAQPRFSAVEQVWEQAALGFLSESELDRQMMQKQIDALEAMKAELMALRQEMGGKEAVPRK